MSGKGDNRRPTLVGSDEFEDNYEAVFGKFIIPNSRAITPGRVRKDNVLARETLDKDIVKMGKEICRMTKLGEKRKHKELSGAIEKKLFSYKEDKALTEKITRDVIAQHKAETHRC